MARLPALILILAFALASTAGVAAAEWKKASRGAQVAKVQRWVGVTADGVFGKGTRKAVRRWQRRHGIHADGVVGPAAWTALRRGAARGPPRAPAGPGPAR